MKKLIPTFLAGAAFAAIAAAANAQSVKSDEVAEPAYVVADSDERGRVTKVSLDGQLYDICVEEGQDSCINPRDAGLDFGARELGYWPGKPASEIEEPLPATPPAAPAETQPNEADDAVDSGFTDLNDPAEG